MRISTSTQANVRQEVRVDDYGERRKYRATRGKGGMEFASRRRLHIASGDGFGVKRFSKQELDTAVRGELALKPAPVRPLGTALGRPPQSQLARFLYSFQIDYL